MTMHPRNRWTGRGMGQPVKTSVRLPASPRPALSDPNVASDVGGIVPPWPVALRLSEALFEQERLHLGEDVAGERHCDRLAAVVAAAGEPGERFHTGNADAAHAQAWLRRVRIR